jgi:hypothetical protein
MTNEKQKDAEAIQMIVARYVATHPVGRNLALIGGFKYRFLDASVRASDDIDYHWAGNLEEKQKELVDSFRRGLLPEVSRLLGYFGRVDTRTGPDSTSPAVRGVDLSFWKDKVPYSRIEISVDVTCIPCTDPVEVRTVGGTIYATTSEGDMIESKIIAILDSTTLRHRDMIDVFLFQDRFCTDSAERLKFKLQKLSLNDNYIEKRMRYLQEHTDYHAKAIQEVIDSQLDPLAAAQLNDSGGGEIVLATVINTLNRLINLEKTDERD